MAYVMLGDCPFCLLHCFTMEPLAIFQLQSLETGHIGDNCCTLPIIAADKILYS